MHTIVRAAAALGLTALVAGTALAGGERPPPDPEPDARHPSRSKFDLAPNRAGAGSSGAAAAEDPGPAARSGLRTPVLRDDGPLPSRPERQPPPALNRNIEVVPAPAPPPAERGLAQLVEATKPYVEYVAAAAAALAALGGALAFLAMRFRTALHRRKWARMRAADPG